MAFAPNNVYGRRGAPVTDALRRAALAGDQAKLRRAVERCLSQAAAGSLPHLAWIADRLDGGITKRVEVQSVESREVDMQHLVQLVLAARTSSATDAQVIDSPALSTPAPSGDPPTP